MFLGRKFNYLNFGDDRITELSSIVDGGEGWESERKKDGYSREEVLED